MYFWPLCQPVNIREDFIMKQSSAFRQFKSPSYLQSSTTMFLFFASWGIWWSFFQLWLTSDNQGLGLTGTQVGTIFSINSIASLILMFIYGTVQDKLFIKRTHLFLMPYWQLSLHLSSFTSIALC